MPLPVFRYTYYPRLTVSDGVLPIATTPYQLAGADTILQPATTANGDWSTAWVAVGNTAGGVRVLAYKTRGATPSEFANVVESDTLVDFAAAGTWANTALAATVLRVVVAGTWTPTSRPTVVTLENVGTGDTDATPRLTLSANGWVAVSNTLSVETLSAGGSLGTVGQTLRSGGVGAGTYWDDAVVGSGSVASVSMTTPTGLTVAGSPITTTGTLALSLQSGYTIPGGGTLGQVLHSQGAGVAPTWSTATFPVTAGVDGTVQRSDGTNWVTSTLVLPNAATQYRIPYATVTNTWGESAGLTYTGSAFAVTGTGTFTSTLAWGTAGAVITSSSDVVLSGTAPTLTGTNFTGIPIASGISGLGTNVGTFLVTPSSANLAAAVTGETGSGALVFATSPTLVTPALGTPSSGILTNATGLPAASVVAGSFGAGNYVFSTGIALSGGTPSTHGLVLPAGTPAVLTSALYSPDGGTLYFNGNLLAVAAGSDVSGSGVNTHVAYWSAASVLTSSANFTFDGTTVTALGLTVTNTITGSVSGSAGSITGNLVGDVTSSGMTTTLATVNSNVGTFGSSTAIPTVTVNAKGLITAASTAAVVAPAGTLSGATLASGVTASSLTSVGTITTGVWQGTAVALAYGGTNANLTPVNGGVIYSTASAMATTAAGTTGQVLTSQGAAAPIWAAPGGGTITGSGVSDQLAYWMSTTAIGSRAGLTHDGNTLTTESTTGPQLKVAYNPSNTATLSVGSTGVLTVNATSNIDLADYNTIYVKPGHNTISAAVTAMANGDCLIMGAGIYTYNDVALTIPAGVRHFAITGQGSSVSEIRCNATSIIDGIVMTSPVTQSTGTVTSSASSLTVTGTGTSFSSSWVGHTIMVSTPGSPGSAPDGITGIVASVESATSLTITTGSWAPIDNPGFTGANFVCTYFRADRAVFRGFSMSYIGTTLATTGTAIRVYGSIYDAGGPSWPNTLIDDVSIAYTGGYNGYSWDTSIQLVDARLVYINNCHIRHGAGPANKHGIGIHLKSCSNAYLKNVRVSMTNTAFSLDKGDHSEIIGTVKHGCEDVQMISCVSYISNIAYLLGSKALQCKFSFCESVQSANNAWKEDAWDDAGGYHKIHGCYLDLDGIGDGTSIDDSVVWMYRPGTIISDCSFEAGGMTASMNMLRLESTATACNIHDNLFRNLPTGTGILVLGDHNRIASNMFENSGTTNDILIYDSTVEKCFVFGNMIDTAITNNGTLTEPLGVVATWNPIH